MVRQEAHVLSASPRQILVLICFVRGYLPWRVRRLRTANGAVDPAVKRPEEVKREEFEERSDEDWRAEVCAECPKAFAEMMEYTQRYL